MIVQALKLSIILLGYPIARPILVRNKTKVENPQQPSKRAVAAKRKKTVKVDRVLAVV